MLRRMYLRLGKDSHHPHTPITTSFFPPLPPLPMVSCDAVCSKSTFRSSQCRIWPFFILFDTKAETTLSVTSKRGGLFIDLIEIIHKHTTPSPPPPWIRRSI